MEVSKEKLSELAESFKKLRVFRNERGQLYIRENAMDSYDKLSENMPIIKENFKYFANFGGHSLKLCPLRVMIKATGGCCYAHHRGIL